MRTNQTGKRKKMSVHAINIDASKERLLEKIRYVKENISIGTPIRMKILGGTRTEYRILKLQRIEGKHYIFISDHGWVESYTMNQLCFEVANGNIKIVKEDKNDDKK